MLELPSEEQVRKTKSTVVGKAISEKVDFYECQLFVVTIINLGG